MTTATYQQPPTSVAFLWSTRQKDVDTYAWSVGGKPHPIKKSGRPQGLEIAPHRNPDKKLQKKCSKIILESLQSFAHKTNTNAP